MALCCVLMWLIACYDKRQPSTCWSTRSNLREAIWRISRTRPPQDSLALSFWLGNFAINFQFQLVAYCYFHNRSQSPDTTIKRTASTILTGTKIHRTHSKRRPALFRTFNIIKNNIILTSRTWSNRCSSVARISACQAKKKKSRTLTPLFRRFAFWRA